MTTFKLLKDESDVVRTDAILMTTNGIVSTVPNNMDNADWRFYQAWLALGNTPEAA